jgi:hypothetical protein
VNKLVTPTTTSGSGMYYLPRLPYKRGVARSNPAAPTQKHQVRAQLWVRLIKGLKIV